ncbi:MAG TPA: ComEC/Rec2 family competence protein [Opitutaceae bacterium]|nr:ComEC/Rec2 family competence protein [Opitutaceae bacterium]
MQERSLGQRAPVLWLLLPTMAGFAVARALPAGWGGGWWLLCAAVGVALAWWSGRGEERRARVLWAGGVALAVGAAAVAYFQLRENRLAVWARLPAREAELVLEIERVFPPAAGRVTTTGFARIAAAPAVVAEAIGQRVYFSVRAPAEAELVRSAQVRALGVLTPLARETTTGFDGYLVSSGAAFKFNRARWLAQERGAGAYRRFCAAAAKRFERILGLGLEDRPALRSIHVAMLLGSKAELSEEQRELFMNSGTMHLFAISGLHIAVIWAVLAGLLEALRVPRLAVAAVGLPALWLYVEITGGAPSAQRAWLMIAFVIAAKALRWARNPVAGIAASALVVLWWAPWQLFGLGFQMSYAVVAALLLYGLPLEERLQRRWRPWADLPPAEWGWWRRAGRWLGAQVISGAALAVAATLVSVPMTLASFGLMTPGSLVVNLACIPASSLAIVAGIGSILAGLLGLEPVSVFFNHASALTIATMERGLAWAMRVPGAHWPAEFRAEWLGTAVLVVLLGMLLTGYALRWRKRLGGTWAPVAVVVLLLAVLARHGAPEDAPAEVAAPANLPVAGSAAIAPSP